ncbi:MAG: DsrE family protein, partial [Betaproteobacteria bacterium]|nr:DsrE family protein [Betaproteobacteria bacterium]
MKALFILNHAPYGTELCYNALRLAAAMIKQAPDIRITVFLMADAVLCAKTGQKTPDGYYNIERMVKRIQSGDGKVLLCGLCMDARGLTDDELLAGAKRSSMDELAEATLQADK